MPSVALQDWTAVRAVALDEIENAHRSVGGTGPGRRYATQHLNQAYAVLLAAQFQAFCRNLHTECVNSLVPSVAISAFRLRLHAELLWNRKLDRGNPNPSNLGADFARLGVNLWSAVEVSDARNPVRKAQLEELNLWRNAIAHQDFDPALLGRSGTLTLARVRAWRGVCNGLAESFDEVMRLFLLGLTGMSPW
jgi:predicted Rdx family selenoprotein